MSSETNTYYSFEDAKLVVGEDAYMSSIEQGYNVNDLHPLRSLLLGEIDITSNALAMVDKPNFKQWTNERFTEYIKWLGNSIFTEGDKLNEDVIIIANSLGLGPSEKQFGKRGGLSSFYEEAGLKNVYKRGVYDSWTRHDLAKYVGKIARETPKNESLRKKLRQAAKSGDGPSEKVIQKRVGSVGNALTIDGLIDPNTMDTEDYLEWGVKYSLANNGNEVESDALEYMSPRRLSPSRSAIVRNFGSLESFKLEVLPIYKQRKFEIEENKNKAFSNSMSLLASDEVPVKVIANASNEMELIRLVAQYKVADNLFNNLVAHKKIDYSKMNAKSFSDNLLKLGDGTLTAADIEEMAEMLGVYDFIWPSDQFMTTLQYSKY